MVVAFSGGLQLRYLFLSGQSLDQLREPDDDDLIKAPEVGQFHDVFTIELLHQV